MNEQIPSISLDGLNLPYSAEAEQAVLGCILLESERLSTVMEILPTADYFHLSNHKLIYQSMIDLFTVSKPVDFITVSMNAPRTPCSSRVFMPTMVLPPGEQT